MPAFSLLSRAAFSEMFLGTPRLGILQRVSVRLEELVLLPSLTPSSVSAIYVLGFILDKWVPLLHRILKTTSLGQQLRNFIVLNNQHSP